MLVPKPLILFIDAYDSFSNNIISLLETTLDVSVRTIKIDNPALATEAALHEELRHYVAVVCGPGPGHPTKQEDVGFMRRIWKLGEKEMLPVLGICLGFQSLCLEFGAEVKRLKGPQHGIIRRLRHAGEQGTRVQPSIFHDVGNITATLYQSLCADIGQDSIPKRQWNTKKWNTTTRCPDLLPLAWAEHDLSFANDAGVEDARVLVAVQHVSKPFWALQYHPESICTNSESIKVLQQWFVHAGCWNKLHRQRRLSFEGPIQGQVAVRESLLEQNQKALPIGSAESISLATISPKVFDEENMVCHSLVVPIPPNTPVADIVELIQGNSGNRIIFESSNANERSVGSADVRGRYSIIGLDVDDSLRYEYTAGSNFIRTIYGRSGERHSKTINLVGHGGVWPFLARQLARNQVVDVVPEDVGKESPFWGGYMGYTTYELGLETIGVELGSTNAVDATRPDLCFAWITRSIVIDHAKNIIYIQELAQKSDFTQVASWQNDIRIILENGLYPLDIFAPSTTTFCNIAEGTTHEQLLLTMIKEGVPLPRSINFHYSGDGFNGIATADYHNLKSPSSSGRTDFLLNRNLVHICDLSRPCKSTPQPSIERVPPSISREPGVSITTPQNEEYERKVRDCQESIRNGDSYELCLTDQTLVTVPKSPLTSPWNLYKTLRARQPAPFASYIRLGSTTLVSASPERFLKYSAEGKCELRPMKGTVRKSAEVSTLAQATALLDIPKEKAENLMIVDLVRHDLHGVCGSGNVSVPRLMVVEEYKSVFQMISIVQGQIPHAVDPELKKHMSEQEIEDAMKKRYTGLDVLAASLPPGSMTGAPKKRSCEILQEIESGKDRSLYSGVVGYMDVAGRGDWSVNIRCMFKWDDEDGIQVSEDGENVETETWHIGAGGAVTTLSTPKGEREEMLTKLSGTLGLFR